MKKATLHWKHNRTGQTGHGKPIELEAARAHVIQANKKFPNISHWLVEEKST